MGDERGVIVVGVDDSVDARAALAFALDEGVEHGDVVEVVSAWLWSSPYAGMDHVGTLAEGQQVVAEAQDLLIGSVLEGRSRVPVISRTVVHENAGRALVERAEGARMLVVGSARKGVVRRALLGSVSEHCVRYAPAPVVVVSDESRLRHRARRDLQAVVEGPSGAR
jgi:nucleotide-binding universal stress UspA family protein